MIPLDLREPVSALTHGTGMMLALPVTWYLWKKCGKFSACEARGPRTGAASTSREGLAVRRERLKAVSLLAFGTSLTFCYAASAMFHAWTRPGASLNRFQRLDHIGIYLLIAGTYTPIVSTLMRGRWLGRTLTLIWSIALICGLRVWFEGVLPVWLATSLYVSMGWCSLFFYRELARTRSHRSLMALPLGGLMYTLGATINVAHWPVFVPGVFGSHELFHLFVIAGSACHVAFMLSVVVPAHGPDAAPVLSPVSARTRTRPQSSLWYRWARAVLNRRVRAWMLRTFPRSPWAHQLLALVPIESGPGDHRPMKMV